MKNSIFENIIEAIYWFLIFLSPFLFFTVVGIILFLQVTEQNTGFLILIGLSILGSIVGIIWAEKIRKNIGCTKYMGKILGTPDIWPDEEKKKHP